MSRTGPNDRPSRHPVRCGILPPYIAEAIARNGSSAERDIAVRSVASDHAIRLERAVRPAPQGAQGAAPERPAKRRTIHDAAGDVRLPGTVVRAEGDDPTGDVAVSEAYDGLGATFDLYWDLFSRNSIDGEGLPLLATVHYDLDYDNAFWDGERMIFGDGDREYFNRFTVALDVIGHELTHGVTGSEIGLDYQGQSGALNESVSDVFGSLVKQWSMAERPAAVDADWLIGAGLFTERVSGVALRSMKAPGTAFDDPVLGRDPQPATMAGYVQTVADNGGVHTNSGIPNHAFYRAAIGLGGYAWDQAGPIWYATITDAGLPVGCRFEQFASLTVRHADALFGVDVRTVVADAWAQVGVELAPSEL